MIGPIQVLQEVAKRLSVVGVEYFLVGSLASMYYGRPRFTNDIDIVVEIKAQQIAMFTKLFEIQDFYCPPAEILKDEVLRRGAFNLIHQNSGIKIDMVLRKETEFSRSEFSRRQKVLLAPGFEAFIATPEDVIIKKLDYFREGGSEKHLHDIREILAGTEVDQIYLQRWVLQLGLVAEWAKV